MSIGDAGVITSSGSSSIVTGSDDWWVVYPSSAGATVTFTVADNAASNASCAGIWAGLYDTTGTGQRITTVALNPGTSGQLSGRQAGSDRYFVEVTPWGCASAAPYTVTLNSGGGGTPPDPASASLTAGTSVASAWPPLQGHTSYPATLSAGSSEDWYVLYKKPDTVAATIRIANTSVAGAVSCSGVYAHLYNSTGTGQQLNASGLNSNQTVTYSLSGAEASDAQGRYFLEVSSWGCNNGGQTYTVEPEPGAEFGNPARVPFAPSMTAGTSIGSAWPPLKGGLVYRQTLSTGGSEDWYVLYKKPDGNGASIRLTNTTVDGSVSCNGVYAHLYDSTGTGQQLNASGLSNNQAVTYTFSGTEANDPQGRYFLEVTTWGCNSGGQAYTVEPEPGAEFLSPTRVPFASSITAGPALAAAWPPLQGGLVYRHALSAGSSEDWYVLYKMPSSTAATIRITNTTVDGAIACNGVYAHLYDSTGVARQLQANGLNNNQAVTYTFSGTEANDPQGRYFLEITTWGCSSAGQAYTIEPEPGAQFGNPSRVPSATGIPASSAASAWPPLHGAVRTTQTLGTGTDQDWYILYKKADSAAATIRITNSTVDGAIACNGVIAYLYDYTGQHQLQATGLSNNQVVTYSVSGEEAGSTQGRYFLKLIPWGCTSGGQGYSVEPEPGGEWNSASSAMPYGPSRKAALGPLAGNVNYTASVTSSTAQDWAYFTAKAALSVRVYNASGSSAGCSLTATTYTSGGTKVTSASVSAGKVAGLKVPTAGTYYLELSTGGCQPTATLSALVDVAGSVAGPVLKVASTTLKSGTHGASYSATISVSGGTKPYTFTAVTGLPSGLSLSKSTGAVTGTPVAAGSYSFTVTITDATKPTHNVLTVLEHITIN